MDGTVVGMTTFGISSVINYGLMVIRGVDMKETEKETLSAIDVAKILSGNIFKERAASNLGCNAVGCIAGKKGYEMGAVLGKQFA